MEKYLDLGKSLSVKEYNRPSAERNIYSNLRNLFIQEPSLLSSEISKKNGFTLEEISSHYKSMQSDQELQSIVSSIYYPRRIMFEIGRSMVKDFDSDREYIGKLLSGEPVSSRVVEIHATKGTCNYSCNMCLWSNQNKNGYSFLDKKELKTLSLNEWEQILVDIKKLGTKTVVFSGGGEILLNKDFFNLVEISKNLNLKTQLYTNGYNVHNLNKYEIAQLLAMDKIRFSIHSPFEEQYNQISNISPSINALPKVVKNIGNLLALKESLKSETKIGIGFVIQPINFAQISDMIDFSKNCNVDFLNIRSDELNITNPLNIQEQAETRKQINLARSKITKQEYNQLIVDFSDNLTAFANNENYDIRGVSECMSKFYRPTINPFGFLSPCDLKAEPRFFDPEYVIGSIRNNSTEQLFSRLKEKTILSNCKNCMPSGQTGNAIFTKIVNDYKSGIDFKDQPFFI